MSKWSRAFGQSSGGVWIENRAEILFYFILFTFFIQKTARAQAQK